MTISSDHIPYTDSIKYLGFTFASSHKDDNDILRQMRMLYERSNRLVRLFHSCNRDVLLELGRSFVDHFTVVTCGHTTKNQLLVANIYNLEACASRQTVLVMLFNSDYYSALCMCHNIVLSLLFYYYSISCMFYLWAFYA